jgi:hypothetical protein
MRISLVLAIWIFILSGLFLYMEARDRATLDPAPVIEGVEAAESYALEITTLTALEQDPFALTAGREMPAETILVRLNGKTILSRTETVASGVSLRVDPVPGLLAGMNEIFLGATPPSGEKLGPAAIRVQLFNGLVPVLDETLWADGGSKISSAISFSLSDAEEHRGRP